MTRFQNHQDRENQTAETKREAAAVNLDGGAQGDGNQLTLCAEAPPSGRESLASHRTWSDGEVDEGGPGHHLLSGGMCQKDQVPKAKAKGERQPLGIPGNSQGTYRGTQTSHNLAR